MTIEDEIIAWALERPAWQQELLVSLSRGQVSSEIQIEALVDRVLEADAGAPNRAASEISIRPSLTEQVQLSRISGAHGVNALIDGQELSFAPTGLSVIYGDNGSGKSGYARLIKSVVTAHHAASVLPDVFEKTPARPTADITYTVDGVENRQHYPETAAPALLKMRFYDEYCGDEYLTKTSTISYRPSALALLDGLIDTCDEVRRAVQQRIADMRMQALKLDLSPQTTAGAFIAGLSTRTTDDEIDKATRLEPGTTERLAHVLQEEARLTASNPEKEKQRLTGLSVQLGTLARELTTLADGLNEEQTNRRITLKATAEARRAAATLAASQSFDDEPLPGVGTETWRTLWDAARQYSTQQAYHDHGFPAITDGDRCVFCQQSLNESARDRLQRFNSFMTDTTELDALAAERAHASSVAELRTMTVATPERTAAIAALQLTDQQLAADVETFIQDLDIQRTTVLNYLLDRGEAPIPLAPSTLPTTISSLASTLKANAQATDVDAFRNALAQAVTDKAELQDSVRLAESADKIRIDVERLREIDRLEAAKNACDTSAITAKGSQLTRQYAGAQILDQFTRETERLDLQRVTLVDLGGHKGHLNQRPGLLGASDRRAQTTSVLSEGEQTALGLAGFFTEVVFDESKSAIILDDPVTSLDHERRHNVARRLAQLAKDRQVVVFSHDIVFVGELIKAADYEDTTLADWAVERRGDQPGICSDTFPWKAKDIRQRIDTLDTELKQLIKDRPTLNSADYQKCVDHWAGGLSETWERSVISEIVDQVFDRGTSEVRVKKFRLFSQITEQDRKDFDEGYSYTSTWARRHDKSPATNYVPPEPPALQRELDRIRAWHKRIKGYLK